MRGFRALVRRFAHDERATTSIEYGLIAMLIAIGAIGGMQALGGGLSGGWGSTATKVSNAMKAD